jgi:hypothetical protein
MVTPRAIWLDALHHRNEEDAAILYYLDGLGWRARVLTAGTGITITDGGEPRGALTIASHMGTSETVTTGSPTLDSTGVSLLDSSGGAITATLGSGDYTGSMKLIVMTDATTSSTVSVTSHATSDPEVFTFAQVDDALLLMWTGNEWITVANNGAAV